MKLSPAEQQVYTHLQSGATITRVEAQAVYRIFDLPGRIIKVRRALEAAKSAETITTTWSKDATGKRYARYALARKIAEVEMPTRQPIPRDHAVVPYQPTGVELPLRSHLMYA